MNRTYSSFYFLNINNSPLNLFNILNCLGTMDIDFEVDPAKAARGDLMSSLNKGADITKGLKKVSDDQKTHKNPTLRSTGVVPSKVILN